MTKTLIDHAGLMVVSKSRGSNKLALEITMTQTPVELDHTKVKELYTKLGEWLLSAQNPPSLTLRAVVLLRFEAKHQATRDFFKWLETAGVPYEPTQGGVLLLNPNDSARVREWVQMYEAFAE